MVKNLKKIILTIDALSIWSGKITSWVILPVIFITVGETLSRYLFSSPTTWGSDITVFGSALIFMICPAWVSQQGRQVRIDVFYGRFSPRTKSLVDSLTFFLFLLFISFLLWASIKYAYNSTIIFERGDSPWRPHIWPMKIALATGMFLIMIQGIANFIRDAYFTLTGKKL